MKKILCLIIAFILMLPSASIAFANEDDTVYVRTSDMEYTEFGTGWNSSGLKDDLNKATRVASSNGNSCEWRPNLKEGYYTVWVFKIFHTNSAKIFNFEVVSGEGKEVVTLNYADGTSGWVKLGTYFFNEGTDGYVYGSGSSGNLRGGPMKFVKAPEPGVFIEKKMFSDTSESNYEEAIEFITKLGISDVFEGEFRPTDNITYNEFMTFIAHCMGEENAVKTSNADSITYNEAIKEIIYMLGYEVMAEKDGRYPNGYQAVASRLNILKKTKQSGNTPITREIAAQLIYNATSVDLLQTVGYGKYLEFESVEGVNVLSEYMGIYEIEGQVTANYYTTLTGDSPLDEGKVKIGSKVYLEGNTNADEFIGQRVTVFAKGENAADELKTILHIESEVLENDIIKVESDDIQPETTVREFRYSRGGKSRNVSIEINPVVIFNGKAKINYSAADFKPAYGDVTLIDNDSNGKYDVIISNNYKTLIVDGIDTYLKKLHFKNETEEKWKSISFDEDSNKKIYFKNADGSDVVFEDISEWNVISVAQSDDGEVIRAIRSDARIRGKIDSLSEDEAEIKDKVYKLSSTLVTNPAAVKPNVRDVASYYLDFKSNIVAVDYAESEAKEYGFLRAMAPKGTLSKVVQFKIYNQNDEWEILTADEKVLFNGNKVKTESLLSSSLLFSGDTLVPQMVSFCRDTEGKIEVLNCVDSSGSNQPQNEKLSKISLNYENAESVKVRGGSGAKVLAAKYVLAPDTKIFLLPENLDNEDEYNIITCNDMYDADTLNAVKIYDVDEQMAVGAMSASATALTSYVSTTPVGVVSAVRYALNEDGGYSLKISILSKGNPIDVYASDMVNEADFAAYALTDAQKDSAAKNGILPAKLPLDKLNVGDVIQYNIDRDNNLKAVRVLYRAESPLECEHDGTDFGAFDEISTYDAIYYTAATVVKPTNLGVVIEVPQTAGSDLTYTRFHLSSNNTIAVRYITDEEKVETVKFSDIVQGDKVFLYKRMGALDLVLIIK